MLFSHRLLRLGQMNINLPECTNISWSDTTLYATCYGKRLSQQYAHRCQSIYYANGQLECIPQGSYTALCSKPNVRFGQLTSECPKGATKVNSTYNVSHWAAQTPNSRNNRNGQYVILRDGQLL